MVINKEIKQMIQDAYNKMRPNEDVYTFPDGILEGLSIYKKEKPTICMFNFSDEDKKVYFGSDTE